MNVFELAAHLGRRGLSAVTALAVVAATLAMGLVLAPAATAAQPAPGFSGLVPQKPRTDTPTISNGEIVDIAVAGDHAYVAGSFTTIADKSGDTTAIRQAGLASFNWKTGKVDRLFKPTFSGGGVSAVEASPDGTKLFVAGSFSSVNGVTAQKVASLNPSTGAPVSGFSFTGTTNNQATALAATNSTVYVGGKFTKVNGVSMSGLAAVNASTGAVDASFNNPITGGIGVNGALTVQQLKLTHDESKLLVVHTGRQIAGQDRLGMGIIDTATKKLLPWRSHLWDDNLARVGGVTRIYAGDIAPDDSYFVVSSGSGGDAPPISDTAIAYPLTAASLSNNDVQPLWIHRSFDSTYSVAITKDAVYIGGHFSWNDSPTANDPYPGLDNVGYGTGQGLSGYGLGDQVVRRDHLGALDPKTGRAVEWDPGSNSFEGNKAMLAFSGGLLVGGDGNNQGGVKTGRIAFYDLSTVPAATQPDTTITAPIEGRVVQSGVPFTIQGQATVSSAQTGIRRVQVEVQDRDTKRFLQADGTTWGTTTYPFQATLGSGTTTRSWSLPMTIGGNHQLLLQAKTFATSGASDSTKAQKKIESFQLDDQTPTTAITGPGSGFGASVLTSTSFTMTGTATDDKGVNSLSYWFRDDQNRYLQDDGSVSAVFNTFRGTPDVIGATNATWSYDVTLPHEGVWRGSATATDTAGQADLRSATKDWNINSSAQAPKVTITKPVAMTPPFTVPTVVVEPGKPLTFSGTAADEGQLQNVEIRLSNSTTRESLAADGTWGVGNSGFSGYRISPVNIGASTYNWSYTTPFNLSAGTYSFSVTATDNDGLTTARGDSGSLTLLAQVPGDTPPVVAQTWCPAAVLTCPTSSTTPVADGTLPLAGTASDDKGVNSVELTVFDNDTGRYLQNDGTMSSGFNRVVAKMGSAKGSPSTTWSYGLTLPSAGGNFTITAYAFDTSGQQNASTTGTAARYSYYPGDAPPGFDANLGQPVDGSTFTDGKIVVTGRAIDDKSIAKVDVGVVNAAGQYMSSAGTFTSTTPSYRAAFLNSPGSLGSNFSYTTPVLPAGTYRVEVRPTDNKGQIGALRIANGVVVSLPANQPPVAKATVSCTQNVCTFDGTGSTDENATALTYSWSYALNGVTQSLTSSGPKPVKTFTAPGTYTVTLTVKDEFLSTATTTLTVPITAPTANRAPTATFTNSCNGLVCSVSATGSVDPDTGDVVSYVWSWGDGSTASTASTSTSASHTYAAAGLYTITLTVSDGWGKSATATRSVNLSQPTGNRAPTAVIGGSCTGLTCAMSSSGSTDPDGDAISYSWDWADGTTPSTTASPSHTYAAGGDYKVALTVTDSWGKATTVTRTVTASGPAPTGAPTAAFAAPACTNLTCTVDGSGSSDPDGSIASYSWDWADGAPAGSGVKPSHTYAKDGTYTIKLTVTDNSGLTASTTRSVTVAAPPQATPIAYRSSVSSTGNARTASVRVPPGVAAGDTMVMVLSINRQTTISNPSGWTDAGDKSGPKNELQTRVWTKVATAADAGTTVRSTLGVSSKYDLTLAAYSGVDTANPITASASSSETVNRATHTTPGVAAAAGGDWLVSYWTEKTSTGTGWTLPAGQTLRSTAIGSGAGRVNAVLADATSGAGGVTATSNAASNKAVMWSIVLNRA